MKLLFTLSHILTMLLVIFQNINPTLSFRFLMKLMFRTII
jgi:hypothetical protein